MDTSDRAEESPPIPEGFVEIDTLVAAREQDPEQREVLRNARRRVANRLRQGNGTDSSRSINGLHMEVAFPTGCKERPVVDCGVRKFAVQFHHPQEERAVESTARQERFEARIRSEEKRTLERAAELSGRTLTDFVMGSAHAAALETIERYEGTVLRDARDREAFVDAMLKPRAPSRTLKAAAARYKSALKQSK